VNIPRASVPPEVAPFPVVALPNPQRDETVESHVSQKMRDMGQPRSVVVSA
jgi:hypothetical protein